MALEFLTKGNVIPLRRHPTEMKHQKINEVRAYWEALRKDGQLPTRADINPRGMEGALEFVFLLERIAPGIGRLRIAGMHLNDLMGMEVRGMPLSAMILPEWRDGFGEKLETVFSNPAILEFSLEADRALGRPALSGRMILLPLLGERGESDRALGCLVTTGKIGKSPRRFAISGSVQHPLPGVQRRQLTGASPAVMAPAPAPARAAHSPGFSEPPAAPFLRVIPSENSDR